MELFSLLDFIHDEGANLLFLSPSTDERDLRQQHLYSHAWVQFPALLYESNSGREKVDIERLQFVVLADNHEFGGELVP